jgi:hypothetical protein
MCHKKGLPILLTRYAIATKNAMEFYEDYATGDYKSSYDKFRLAFNEVLNKDLFDSLKASEAPDIKSKANFNAAEHNGKPISMGEHAYYTLRLLRPGGFVYILNENAPAGSPIWRGYYVVGGPSVSDEDSEKDDKNKKEENGKKKKIDRAAWKGVFFEPFDVEKEFAEGKPGKSFPCIPEKNGAMASCIVIPPEELLSAKTIWIAYSDVKWSPSVRSRYLQNTDGCRTKNMRAIDVKKYGKNKHAASIDEVAEHVADYAKNINIAAFDFANTPMPAPKYYLIFDNVVAKNGTEPPLVMALSGPNNDKVSVEEFKKDRLAVGLPMTAQRAVSDTLHIYGPNAPKPEQFTWGPARLMEHQCKKLNENAFFVALDDPVGITADLAELMDVRFETFIGQPSLGRKYATAAGIESLRTAVYNQADLKCIEAAKQNNHDYFFASTSDAPSQASLDESENSEREFRRDYKKDPYAPYVNGEWEDWQNNYSAYGLLSAPLFERFREHSWKRYLHDLPAGKRLGDIFFSPVLKTGPGNAKKRFNDEDVTAFLKALEEKKTAFSKACILPLANAHVAWMSSPALVETFKWHFDEGNPRYGIAILDVLGECIGGSQDKGPCEQLYMDWLSADTSKKIMDDKNLIWKGLRIGGLGEVMVKALPRLASLNLDPNTAGDVVAAKVGEEALANTTRKVDKIKETTPIADAAKKAATNSKGVLDQTLGKGTGAVVGSVMDIEKNWEATRKSWNDPVLFDSEKWAAFPMLEKTTTLFGFLIKPLEDVAKYVALNGTPSKAKLNNPAAKLLYQLTGGWLNRFIVHVSGPAARVFQSSITQGKIAPILFYMSAANRKVTMLMQASDTAENFARHLMRQVLLHAQGGTSAGALDVLEDRMRVIQAETMGINPSLQQSLATEIDFDDFKKLRDHVPLYNGMSANDQAEFRNLVNRALKSASPQVHEALREARYADVGKMLGVRGGAPLVSVGSVDEAAEQTSRAVDEFKKKSSRTVVRGIGLAGTFQGVLSWSAMAASVKALDKAWRLDGGGYQSYASFDATGRLLSAAMSAVYTIANAASELMKKVPKVRLMCRLSTRVLAAKAAKYLFKAAQVVTAVMDTLKGIKRAFDGKNAEAGLLIVSAAATFLGILSYFAAGWPMVILFLVSLAIVVVIEIIKDDAYQEWLSKCCFGTGDANGEHYSDMKLEMLALEEAGK